MEGWFAFAASRGSHRVAAGKTHAPVRNFSLHPPIMSPSLSLLIEQLNRLAVQLPVSMFFPRGRGLFSNGDQSLQVGISPTPTAEQVSAANQFLTNARSIRDELALESADATRKLSEAVLAVILYTEATENTSRLLMLADSCVGQIWSRMRAHGIPIHAPPASSDGAVIPTLGINREVTQGQSFHLIFGPPCSDEILDEPALAA